MKTTLTFVATTLICVTTYAADKADIEKIAHTDVSKEQVEKVFGNPTHISQSDNKSMWEYKTQDFGIQIVWNESSAKMERMSFLSKDHKKTNWDAGLLGNLSKNASNVKDVLGVLGTPNDLLIEPYAQKLRYKYKDHVFMLEFQKGVLKRYELLHA